MKYLITLVCLIGLLLPNASWTKDKPVVHIGLSNELELFDPSQPNGGYLGTLLVDTFAEIGMETKISWYPLRRLRNELITERIDATFPWTLDAERDQPLLISQPIYKTKVYALSLKQAPVTHKDLLKNTDKQYVAAIIFEDYFGELITRLEKEGKLKLLRLKTYHQALNVLLKQRADFILIDEIIAKKILTDSALKNKLYISQKPLLARDVYMAFSPQSQHIKEAFARAQQMMQRKGLWILDPQP